MPGTAAALRRAVLGAVLALTWLQWAAASEPRLTEPRLTQAGSQVADAAAAADTSDAADITDAAYPLGGAYPGEPTPQQRNQQMQSDAPIQTILVRQGDLYPQPEGSVYMLVGAGGNLTVQVGSNGLLLVNAGKAEASQAVLAALHKLSDAPLRTIIDTDIDADDAGGNQALFATGQAVTGGDVTNLLGAEGAGQTDLIAAQSILDRMSTPGSHDARPEKAWPNDTYTGEKHDLWFNGESIRVLHVPAAHTDGDSFVYFRHSDVISVGNIFSTCSYPPFDTARGGSFAGVLAGLNRLIYDLMIPGPQNDGGTLIIPNHGYLSSFSDVVFYQEMLIIIRDRIQHLIDRGYSLQRVLAARPTLDYDARYGTTSGAWTTQDFVTAVYQELRQKSARGHHKEST